MFEKHLILVMNILYLYVTKHLYHYILEASKDTFNACFGVYACHLV
jgi:hypothetical protein